MNSRENHEPMSDPFDVWLQSCPAADVPEGLRARCLATIPASQQTEDAVRAAPTVEAAASPATPPDTVRLHKRKRTLFRIARHSSVAVAAAAAAVVGVVAGYFLLVHPTASVTFAQVIENVTKAESISFVARQKMGSQPAIVSRLWMQQDKIRMDLVGVEISADLTGPQAEGVRKLRELGEGGKLPVLLTLIVDTSRQEAVELDHFRKTAVKSERMYLRGAVNMPQNLIEQFRNIKGDDAELVGEEQREGRTVLVYRLTELHLPNLIMARKEPGDQMEMTVWVDAKTGLPVRIRIEGALSATRNDHSFLEWYEFAWNQPLDPGLFSLEIPEGYAVKEPPPAPAGEETATPGSKEMIKREIEKARAAREAAIEREGKAPPE